MAYQKVAWKKRTKDLQGQTFGRLKVIKFTGREAITGRAQWECLCSCGKTLTVNGNRLLSKNVQSCGCLNRDVCIERSTIHGDTDKPLWKMWSGILARCNSSYHISYKHYGGRGITYDPRWNEYLEFKKDMGKLYDFLCIKSKGKYTLSIERINVNGNYCKENCTFIPKGDQAKNTRVLKWFIGKNPDGKEFYSKNQSEFSRKHNIGKTGIFECLKKRKESHKGWTFEYAPDSFNGGN